MKYKDEYTDRDVKPMEVGASPTEKEKVVWDTDEAIGIELPFGDVVTSDPGMNCTLFLPENLQHTLSITKRIEKYIKEQNISEIWIG